MNNDLNQGHSDIGREFQACYATFIFMENLYIVYFHSRILFKHAKFRQTYKGHSSYN